MPSPARPAAALLATLAIAAAAGLAQPAAKPRSEPSQPEARERAEPKWPPFVEKEVYADDFRGRRAPEITVAEMLTERPDRKGKVVVVDLWATWCGPCRKLIPELNRLQKEFKDDVVVLGISNESADVVRRFLESNEVGYAVGVDPDGTMSKELNVRGIPHVLVISTDGIVRWQGFPQDPADPLTHDIVRKVVEADPGVKARREAEQRRKGRR